MGMLVIQKGIRADGINTRAKDIYLQDKKLF